VRSDVVSRRAELRESLRTPPDIVLTDYNLDDWTALDTIKDVREHATGVPVIVVTGTLGDEKAVECVKAGAADYVLKGHLARLPIAVRAALAERQSRALLTAAERRAHEAGEQSVVL